MARGFGGKGFGGVPGGGNMNALLKQAQKMQQDMQQAQADVEASVVEGSAGGGMVTLKMDGRHQVQELNIKPEAVDPDDVEMLQDLVLAALSDAAAQLEKLSEEKMGRFRQLGMGMGL